MLAHVEQSPVALGTSWTRIVATDFCWRVSAGAVLGRVAGIDDLPGQVGRGRGFSRAAAAAPVIWSQRPRPLAVKGA